MYFHAWTIGRTSVGTVFSYQTVPELDAGIVWGGQLFAHPYAKPLSKLRCAHLSCFSGSVEADLHDITKIFSIFLCVWKVSATRAPTSPKCGMGNSNTYEPFGQKLLIWTYHIVYGVAVW